jgi:TatD DNase family protein
MKYIDTHTHVNLSEFDEDRDEVLTRAKNAGVAVVNIGTDSTSSKKAIDIAEAYDDVYAVIGSHPIDSAQEEYSEDHYRQLGLHSKVIAIGECGLDYFHATTEEEFAVQREKFLSQIHLANELGKPLMLHLRNGKDATKNAYADAVDILVNEAKVRGNAHFFAGTIDDAKLFFDIGFTISFTGVITFSPSYNEVVRYAPADMLHAETDAPYVSPLSHRGQRNEPRHIPEIVKALAMIRGEDEEIFRGQLLENARTLYGISL